MSNELHEMRQGYISPRLLAELEAHLDTMGEKAMNRFLELYVGNSRKPGHVGMPLPKGLVGQVTTTVASPRPPPVDLAALERAHKALKSIAPEPERTCVMGGIEYRMVPSIVGYNLIPVRKDGRTDAVMPDQNCAEAV